MADGNWIKLNRKIWDNFLWDFDSPKYAMAWIDMLLMANYKDKKIMFDGKAKVVKQGSFVTSMVKLSSRWNMSRRTVKNFLDTLQENGMIAYESTKRCTTVFVTNYLAYQGFAGSEDKDKCTTDGATHGTADGTTDGATHGTQHKKVKKVKESEKILTASKEAVCSTDVQRIVEAWNALNLSKVKKVVPGTNRDALFRARVKDYGVDGVLEAIGNIKKSTFLQGGGDKGWKITFDWLIKPNNFPKVLEGNYSDNTAPQPKPSSGQGRKEMVPAWMNKQADYQPSSERINKNGDFLDKFLEDQKAAELNDRVEALKKRISGDD